MHNPLPHHIAGGGAEPAPAARPRIAVLSAGDPGDPKTWSGTPFYMTEALARHLGPVEKIGPLRPPELTVLKAMGRLRQILTAERSLPGQSLAIARRSARMAEARLAGRSVDLIFAPAGSALIAELKTELPIVYTSDATVRLMLNYNPRFTALSARARREAEALERAAIARADLLLYPTDWVARSAVDDYGADPAKIHILPYGANLSEAPTRERALAPRIEDGICRLLFVGVNWTFKGGDIALEALRRLRAEGIAAELTICGCEPPKDTHSDGVTVIPFLDKNRPADRERLAALYARADFLILPTRCECYGIVFCEAAAHGVPSIATATGGVPDVIREGMTGHTLPHDAQGGEYAALIGAIFRDRVRHAALRRSSREDFEQRLNWDGWGRAAAALAGKLLARRR